MGARDRVSNKTQDVKGRIKEATGNLTGDRKMADKGKADQAKASAKQTGEDLKDVGHDLRERIR
jgi:uncharacterized protein YjbJ (UPF0337 family)